ncbi:hypothetical protein ABTD90_20005, partial [Acinetobacter baumannii]
WSLAGYAERRTALMQATSLPADDPWPQGFEPDLCDLRVGISRTEPAYEDRAGVFEVRELYLDAIAGAQHHLFFENQYFTSNVLSEAI